MSPIIFWKLYFTFLYVFIQYFSVKGFNSVESIGQICKLKCDHTLAKENDALYCDISCQTENNDTRSEGRNNILQTQKQSCVRGCNFGLEEYYKQIVPTSGLSLPGPSIVKDGITHSSVLLTWVWESVAQHKLSSLSIVEQYWANENLLSNISFILQKRVLDTNTEWQSHTSIEILTSGRLNVTNLHPYLTYQFKLIFQITSSHAVDTNYSNLVTTLPYGVPASSPTITNLRAPSPTTVSVSWDSPVYTNGPLVSYRLSLHPLDNTDPVISSDIPPDRKAWIFGHLTSNREFQVRVSSVNSAGEGPAHVMNVTTPRVTQLSEKEIPYLVLAADNCVVKQNLLSLIEDAKAVVKRPKSVLTMGLVAIYDEEQFNQELQARFPFRPHLRRQMFSANRGFDHQAARQGREGVQLPQVEELPMMSANERARKLAIQSPNKYKGVYSYNKIPSCD